MSKLIFFVLMFLSGCATVQGYKDSLQTWLGHSDSELFQKWGQPRNSFIAPDGKTVLEFHRERTEVIPGYTYNQAVSTTQSGNFSGDVNGSYTGHSTTYVPQTTPSEVVNKFCDTRFTVSNHTVVAYSFNGNDCVSKTPKLTAEQNNANNKKNEAQESFKNWKAKKDDLCSNPEYQIIFNKSPCDITNVSFELLIDKSIITQEQKPVFVKYRKASGELDKEYRDSQVLYNGVKGRKMADLMESANQEFDKASLDLYEEKITWGEYLQKRRDLGAKYNAEAKRISQP